MREGPAAPDALPSRIATRPWLHGYRQSWPADEDWRGRVRLHARRACAIRQAKVAGGDRCCRRPKVCMMGFRAGERARCLAAGRIWIAPTRVCRCVPHRSGDIFLDLKAGSTGSSATTRAGQRMSLQGRDVEVAGSRTCRSARGGPTGSCRWRPPTGSPGRGCVKTRDAEVFGGPSTLGSRSIVAYRAICEVDIELDDDSPRFSHSLGHERTSATDGFLASRLMEVVAGLTSSNSPKGGRAKVWTHKCCSHAHRNYCRCGQHSRRRRLGITSRVSSRRCVDDFIDRRRSLGLPPPSAPSGRVYLNCVDRRRRDSASRW
jgi:hypothetical protein